MATKTGKEKKGIRRTEEIKKNLDKIEVFLFTILTRLHLP